MPLSPRCNTPRRGNTLCPSVTIPMGQEDGFLTRLQDRQIDSAHGQTVELH